MKNQNLGICLSGHVTHYMKFNKYRKYFFRPVIFLVQMVSTRPDKEDAHGILAHRIHHLYLLTSSMHTKPWERRGHGSNVTGLSPGCPRKRRSETAMTGSARLGTGWFGFALQGRSCACPAASLAWVTLRFLPLLAWLPLQSLAVKKNFFFCKFWAVKNFLN